MLKLEQNLHALAICYHILGGLMGVSRDRYGRSPEKVTPFVSFIF